MVIKDSCGVFGGYGYHNIADLVRTGLFGLQHRGQESAGIVTSDGNEFYERLRQGLVSPNFGPERTSQLLGHIGIGHVRYSTSGGSSVKNTQPLSVEIKGQKMYIAHNGNLDNYEQLKNKMESEGSIFSTTTDSEVFAHLIAKSKETDLEDKISDACKHVSGSYSLLIMTEDKLIGLRDPRGFRPLKLGRIKLNKQSAYFLSYETIAFDDIKAEYIRDIEPNEMIILNQENYHSLQGYETRKLLENDLIHTPCIFESVYFARPDSKISPDGMTYWGLRFKMGQILAQEFPVDADVVISIPDSGNYSAEGYSYESQIPFVSGFIRNHYVGRTFITPNQQKRMNDVDLKLNVNEYAIKDKRVIVTDDSIIRGTTTKGKITSLKNAGAKEVHVRISCPPVRYPCFYGMDFPTQGELVANQYLDSNNNVNINELCDFLGADSLGFLSLDGLLESCKPQGDTFCTACYNGNYPTQQN